MYSYVERTSQGGGDREKPVVSAAVLIRALKQPLHSACSLRLSVLGTAECINYICAAMDPLSNPADCLHLPHVKPNRNC